MVRVLFQCKVRGLPMEVGNPLTVYYWNHVMKRVNVYNPKVWQLKFTSWQFQARFYFMCNIPLKTIRKPVVLTISLSPKTSLCLREQKCLFSQSNITSLTGLSGVFLVFFFFSNPTNLFTWTWMGQQVFLSQMYFWYKATIACEDVLLITQLDLQMLSAS